MIVVWAARSKFERLSITIRISQVRIEKSETMIPSQYNVIFDETGERLPIDLSFLARRLGCAPADGFDVISGAVRNLGFVYVGSIRNAVFVALEPSTVSYLAAFAAFYEIVGRAPKRLVLGYPGRGGYPDRYEIFHSVREALQRVEVAVAASRNRFDGPRSEPDRSAVYQRRQQHLARSRKLGQVVSFRGRDGLAIRTLANDSSRRLTRTLDSISHVDEWIGRVFSMWKQARRGWRLPSNELLGRVDLSSTTRDRAHIVDTSATEPTGYWFRLWGAVNSYRQGLTNQTLGRMPSGLMRDNAIEDYWEVVTTGVPAYHLIRLTEDQAEYSYARLLLPLANDGRRVDRILVLINERSLELEIPRPSSGAFQWGGQ